MVPLAWRSLHSRVTPGPSGLSRSTAPEGPPSLKGGGLEVLKCRGAWPPSTSPPVSAHLGVEVGFRGLERSCVQ